MRTHLFPLLITLLPSLLSAQGYPTGPHVEGKVVFPDGTSAPGAQVFYIGDCQTSIFGEGETTTNSKGEFRFHVQTRLDLSDQTIFFPTYRECDSLLVWASLEEDLWLPTDGYHPFHTEKEGVAQRLELLDGLPRKNYPLTVPLSTRGSQLNIHVWDSHAQQNVEALISLSRHDCSPDPCGQIQVRYTPDASPLSFLLPEGEYRIELNQFHCGSRRIMLRHNSITLNTTTSAGKRHLAPLVFDSTDVHAIEAYDNPLAQSCQDNDI